MRKKILGALRALGSLTLACGRQPSRPAAGGELMEADLAFGRATAEGGLEGWMSFFHPEATIFPSSRPAVTGIDSIRSYYERVKFDPRIIKWKPAREEVAGSGDLGFTYGYSEFTVRNKAGKDTVLHGKYLTVWKRDKEGVWKVFADIGAD